jgi:hypothetical protein
MRLAMSLVVTGRYRAAPELVWGMLSFPFDSTRYFEFEFFGDSYAREPFSGRYLDVSSPRLLPALALRHSPQAAALLLNPDETDLRQTRQLMEMCGLAKRCKLRAARLEAFEGEEGRFDVITSLSVIEHIPMDGAALVRLWRLLKRGGRLLISVPCARVAFDEFINYDEYGLQAADAEGFVFGQRFYDEALLRERFHALMGRPLRQAIYGERQCGTLQSNRAEKAAGGHYPYWREPHFMARTCSFYDKVAALPGWGVIGMEFVKP